ncbi:hypothetical protein Cs7R123_48360 [Catellatospora sp. TT07R-123]|uniref:hypothetical protein n=1 Tax=Catellatospora sp. TT07R-123 TaxID=2733863 RepID=UPI001B036762|nr:hypothetical protein [Catellatospora sp. TT07R-123]GHJ47494.1 hypothetical protein Cs7R123_48360 [Catellatospora sp. TT07R-123]
MATYLRGALVQFMPTRLIPIPNVIVFQYNPESLTHTWTQPQAVQAEPQGGARGNPLAVTGYPGEAFTFTLAMDATDPIADNTIGSGLAKISGVYSRIAALEMLIQPSSSTSSDGLLGAVTSALAGAGSPRPNPPRQVPANKLPVVLFVWGPGRIVPVRVTSLTITEQRYDTLLNPIHAEAQVGLQVLTKTDVYAVSDDLAPLAKAANAYTDSLRQVAAIANLVNAAESIIGMIPH